MKLPDRAITALIMAALFVPLSVAGISSILRLFGEPLLVCVGCDDMQLRAAIYTGGATLMGLAAFGSVIGSGFLAGKNMDKKVLNRGVLLMVGGSIGVIMTQLFLMLNVWCNVLDMQVIKVWVFVTAIYGSLIVLGFAYIFEIRFNRSSNPQDKGQPPASDDKRDGGQSGALGCTDVELDFRFKSRQGDKP